MGFALALSFDDLNAGAMTRQRQLPHQSGRNLAQAFHRSVPSVPSKHGMEIDVDTKAPNGNTFQERLINRITERDLAKAVSDALVVDFGDYSSKHKRIAQAAGAASEKSAENWTQGHNAPSLLYGLRLMAKSPTLRKEIMRLCQLEQELAPEFQEAFATFMRMMNR